MRLDVLRNELEKCLVAKYKFEPDFEVKDDGLITRCNIKIQDLDDNVFMRVNSYTSGLTTIWFVFDKIELTLEVMLRLNAFNESVHWFKAYVNENGFLTLKHPIIDAVLESNVVEALEYLFKIITQEETRQHLRPLTDLTFKEEDDSQPSRSAS